MKLSWSISWVRNKTISLHEVSKITNQKPMKFSKKGMRKSAQKHNGFKLSAKQNNHTNQEKPRGIMKDFRFLGGRWAYGLLKRSEKVETFFLLTKKKSGISKKKNQTFSKIKKLVQKNSF